MSVAQPGFLYTVLVFAGVIGVLVFVHEFGHYYIARLCGVRAETFAIGFGREVAGWTDKPRHPLAARLAAVRRLCQVRR